MAFDDLWQPDCLPSCTFDLDVDERSGNNNNIKSRAKEGVHCKIDLKQRKSDDAAVSLRIDVREKSEVCLFSYSKTFCLKIPV